ncbi:hypothetical protein ABC347_07720 [Sphingomonas sp. 1P06PA]
MADQVMKKLASVRAAIDDLQAEYLKTVKPPQPQNSGGNSPPPPPPKDK